MSSGDLMVCLFALCAWLHDYEHGPEQPLPCELQAITGHPYAMFGVDCDDVDSWVVCCCLLCGDYWQRRCSKHYGVARWTHRYALLHAHGAEPWASCKLLPGAGLVGGH